MAAGAPSNFDNGDFAAKERQLSYGSAFAAAPSAPIPICNNAMELGGSQTRECGAAEQEIGVACGGAACGRPADWPENQPFFMPVNFTSAEQWRNLGMGLSQYRRAAGQAPMLTDNEFNFLQVRVTLNVKSSTIFYLLSPQAHQQVSLMPLPFPVPSRRRVRACRRRCSSRRA